MPDFVHLHVHSEYSLLDGANKIPDILEDAHRAGQPAIAITDHGNLHGALDFYLAAQKIGIGLHPRLQIPIRLRAQIQMEQNQ